MARNCCELTDRAFTEKTARNEARLYRRRGPAGQTKDLLNSIRALGLKNATLLDIGGGIGAIHHELLGDTAREATHVDASSAYLKTAKDEAARRGQLSRVRFVHADFVDAAEGIAPADIVTLDRVVCCYPDYRNLLRAASQRAHRILGLTYPRETWFLRVGFGILNVFQRLRGDPFRSFVHPVGAMHAVLNREGLRRVALIRQPLWEIAVYQRGQ